MDQIPDAKTLVENRENSKSQLSGNVFSTGNKNSICCKCLNKGILNAQCGYSKTVKNQNMCKQQIGLQRIHTT